MLFIPFALPGALRFLPALPLGLVLGMACPGLTAALRALADQVVPHMEEPDFGACNEMRCDIELYTDHQRKRDEILAIAAELEGNQ